MPGSEEHAGLGHQKREDCREPEDAMAADHGEAESILFLGNIDSAKAVSKAQRVIHDQLGPADQRCAISARAAPDQRCPRVHARTRSLLFIALAVAAASGSDASEVLVPENGFTSINLPGDHERSGALGAASLTVGPAFQCARCGPRAR